MKLHQIALAVAATLSAPAFAATGLPGNLNITTGVAADHIVYVSGASAVSGNFGVLATSLCSVAPVVYSDDLDGKQVKAYSCASASVGNGVFTEAAPFIIVKRDKDGSFAGVGPVMASSATVGALDWLDLTKCNATNKLCEFDALNKAATNAASTVNYITDTSGAVMIQPDAGMSDVEIALWDARGQLTAYAPFKAVTSDAAQAVQGFGVFASAALYAEMQASQIARGEIDSSCSGVITPGKCQPNISTAEYATLADANNFATDINVQLLNGGSYTSPLATGAYHICRRVPTSGTQATSDAHFMKNPCQLTNDPTFGFLTPATAGTAGNRTVVEGSSTGNALDCADNSKNAGRMALGVASMENASKAGAGKFLWVKLDGVSPNLDSAARQNGVEGRMSMASELQTLWPAGGADGSKATVDLLMPKLNEKLADPANYSSLPGLWINPLNSLGSTGSLVGIKTRSGNTCNPQQ